MRRFLLLGCVLLGASGLGGTARAQGLDLSHGGPVQVTAADGIDWRQNDQEVVARGDARAVRDNVTVTADVLIAHYRKKAQAASPGQAPEPAPEPTKVATKPASGAAMNPDDSGANEIYRLDAIGHVHIFTATDQAWGDRAVYDMDQAVLVMTGHALKLTTPQDVLTARDDVEYWSQKHMSVARGDAVVVTSDGRRIKADTLVAYTTGNAAASGAQATAKPAAAANGKAQDPLAQSGKLQRVEAFGNVEIRTATETAYGDRGVYVPDTGIARVVGHVRVTRGQNQVNGSAADVDLKTGISTMLSGNNGQVQGLIVPSEAHPAAGSVKPQKDRNAAR